MKKLDINKQQLLSELIQQLNHKLIETENAANQAHKGAIDDQSIAETQYDTLAIESSYLAEGHSKRVLELKSDISLINTLKSQTSNDSAEVGLGSIVVLESESSSRLFLMSPAAGGTLVMQNNQSITVITPKLPLGQKLWQKSVDDECEITESGNPIEYWIAHII